MKQILGFRLPSPLTQQSIKSTKFHINTKITLFIEAWVLEKIWLKDRFHQSTQ